VLVGLLELGEALAPQVGVPCVLVAVRAEHGLHIELGDGGHPPAQGSGDVLLGPSVVDDPLDRLLDRPFADEPAPVPVRERSGVALRAVPGDGVGVALGAIEDRHRPVTFGAAPATSAMSASEKPASRRSSAAMGRKAAWLAPS